MKFRYAICFCWVFLIPNVLAQNTVFDYSDSQPDSSQWSLPQFTEDQWAQASNEAESILNGWESQSVTVPWTELSLAMFVKHKMQPSRGARGLALIHVAMYDAMSHPEAANHDRHIVTSVAAARVLGYLFPAEEHGFDRIVHKVIEHRTKQKVFDPATHKAIKLGLLIGNRIINHAQHDGAQRGWNGKRLQWYGEGRYHGPGSWEPTPPYYYYPPDEPFAPEWKPWVLQSPSQFRPKAPPVYGTPEFMEALDLVIKTDAKLTSKEKQVAEFWVDGHGTVTPAGHWNQIAIEYLSKQDSKAPFNELEVARIFMHLNVAMADTFIAAWDSKYHYWYIRPVTAAEKMLGMKFKPHILTPPFPSYVSGHAATSGAGAAVLAYYFSDHADAIISMGEEAAHSRLLGGIHFKFDNDEGLKLGRKVATHTLKFKALSESIDRTNDD